ncbi:D-3-phosphoglycerate dehydrogenase [Neolewinella xylanilytica]|uniref:D-3-phosphoglycerate dehydrogenase n=1 Tax=Neolewinella xylanilytica TaxID=1514080 RepID=A0A2S6I1M9_9BACT|nr:NAD(P)-dependent oxidoreductase [Neolewinella xylanilytica]PPK85085.1 D-3-phosphoglycerate dehydrogenase [Neolewinella xylanilytica]
MKPVVYIMEPVDERALKVLPEKDFTLVLPDAEPADWADIQALVVRGQVAVDRELIDRCPGLRVIVRNGVGVNNIDVAYATERGIQVLNVPGVNAATVAEHTLGLMLLLVRGMYRLIREVKENNYAYREEYKGRELRGLTLGLIGRGDIGSRVADSAAVFGMEVIYTSRSGGDRADGYRSREELLASADVVSLHLPLTEETDGLMDAVAFEKMKTGSYLINTARGEIVVGNALLAALESGKLAGYASDLMVKGDEDTVNQLVNHNRVLITPHAASLTELTYYELSERGLRHVKDFTEGKAIPEEFRVNRL